MIRFLLVNSKIKCDANVFNFVRGKECMKVKKYLLKNLICLEILRNLSLYLENYLFVGGDNGCWQEEEMLGFSAS